MGHTFALFDGWPRTDMLAFWQVVAGVLALIIAVVALIAAPAQARKTSREVFESYVLRDLLALTDRAGEPSESAAGARIAMLPDNDVPFWRAWVRTRSDFDHDRETDEMIDAMGPPDGLNIEERYRWAFREDIRRTVARKGYRTSHVIGRRRVW